MLGSSCGLRSLLFIAPESREGTFDEGGVPLRHQHTVDANEKVTPLFQISCAHAMRASRANAMIINNAEIGVYDKIYNEYR